MASPSAGAPALNYGDVNTQTTSPGEVKGLIIIYYYFWKNVLEFSKKYKNGKRFFFDELFSNKNYSIIMVNISMNV